MFGMFAWLLATNYQVVYSKMANLISPEMENIENAEQSAETITTDTNLVGEVNDDINEDTQDTIIAATDIEVSEEEIENTSAKEAETQSNDDATQTSTDSNSNEEAIKPQTSVEASNQPSIMPKAWPHTMQPNMNFPAMNPNMMNPGMYMNPMAMMMPMMMGMMSPMMNPAMYMNPMAFMNHPMNTMTQPQNMNAMMMSMDPKMMFGMFGQPSQAYLDGETPDQLPVVTIPGLPTQSYQHWPKNTVTPNTPREAKHNAFQTAMAMSPLSMRNMVSMMADKIPVEEGVSWDDAVEAMKLRANEVNFKFVGSSPLWKQIEAETEKPSAKVEMFRFCDARMARKILDEVPEFIVFLPCKIALLEDAEGKLWVMTLDWDVSWLDYAQNPNNHLSKDIREHAKVIRENIQYIMEGAATGDF